MKQFAYLRIYYERGNGKVALDSGPGTERIEAANVSIICPCDGEHGPSHVRPRFWMVARNCQVKVIPGNIAVVLPKE